MCDLFDLSTRTISTKSDLSQMPPSMSPPSSSSTSRLITFEHTWTMEDFVSLCGDETQGYPAVYSGPFVAPTDRITTPDGQPVQFELVLYPKGKDVEFRDFVSAFVRLSNHSGLQVAIWFSIVDAKGAKKLRCSSIETFATPFINWGAHEMIARAELLNPDNGFLHEGSLVAHCKLSIIQHGEPKATVPSLAEQLADKLYDQTVPLDKWIVDLLDSGAHSDVTLVMVDDGGKELRAHKNILTTRSRVFADMFESKMAESVTNRVEIVETRVEVFEQVLHFIYTGRVTSLDAIAKDLLICADKYQLDPLKSICEKYLAASISTASNLSDLLALANLHDAPKLKVKVLDSIRKKVEASAQLLDMDKLLLMDSLLSSLPTDNKD